MKIRTIAGITAGTALAIALPLLAAERLAVKTGLWEDTVTMNINMGLPAEQLAALPPAQRAQMEQMMKQMGVGAPRTTTEQSCITEKDLDGEAYARAMQEDGQDCDFKQVAATARRQEFTFQCKSAQSGNATGRLVLEALSDTQVRATMQAKMTQGSMDIKVESKWQSADCGNVKPD